MKSLLQLSKILLGAFAVFMVLAMADEHEIFVSAWFDTAAEAPVPILPEDERRAAADTVHQALTLMQHLYKSGGDPRFSERLPASDEVLAEIVEDVAYLQHNHRVQDPSLRRLEVLAVDGLSADRVEVRTRELWTIRLLWSRGGAEASPHRAHVVHGKYLLSRDGGNWQVEAWDVADPS